MTVFTVDLDNTLVSTGPHYTQGKEDLQEFLSDELDVSKEVVLENYNKYTVQLLDEIGLDKTRMPIAFEMAVRELVDDPPEELITESREIAWNIYKSSEQYAEQGFMDGTKEMLDVLEEQADELHLVTVGDPDVQWPKVEGLGLERWFDEIHVVSHEEGKAARFESIIDSTGANPKDIYHVGDSMSSDVKAAVDAGINAIYISHREDWLSSVGPDYQHLLDKPNVHTFSDHSEFTKNITTL